MPRQDVEEVTNAVMAASRLFVAVSARALADIDARLTVPRLRTLVVLNFHGPIKLATLTVTPSTAMRMVDKLEALGLVDRKVNPGNRREVVLRVTVDGQRLVEKVQAHRHEEISVIVGRLPAPERTRLVQGLRALTLAAGTTGTTGATGESAPDLLTAPAPHTG